MPRKKAKTTQVRNKIPFMGGGTAIQGGETYYPPLPQSRAPKPEENDLPWYARTVSKKEKPVEKINNEIMVQWNTAGWIKRLMRVAHKVNTPIYDPIYMQHNALGNLEMRWEIDNRVLDVLVLQKDVLCSIAYQTDDGGQTIAELEDGWSNGSINTEDEIEKVWRWLTINQYDDNFLHRLMSVSFPHKEGETDATELP